MKIALPKLIRQLKNNKRGSTFVLITVFVVTLFGFAALSIDISRVFQEQRHINVGTDAGALAGATLLTNNPQNVASITAEALAIAGANGVTANEIAAGARQGFPGQVQVGLWSNAVFQANAVNAAGRYNAVRVPARRTVDLYFAKVVGLENMRPAVSSIAGLTPAGTVQGALPFGVSINELIGKTFGDTMVLNDAGVTSGNQGKIDLGGYQTPNSWQNDMGGSGCDCTTSVGPVDVITGNAQVKQAWNGIPVGTVLLMPIVQFNGSGNSITATILGFVLVEVIDNDSAGNGSNWSATVKFLDRIVGTAGGGECPEPCISLRTLVQ